MEITLDTKIYDLLKEYPFMEDKLIEINPKYKKLKNPVLRRTVARIASIKQAALVGGMEPIELLNLIRKEVGQPPLENVPEKDVNIQKVPEWVTKEPSVELDGNRLLDEGKNPLAEINKILKELKKDETILLKTDFFPAPLVDEIKKRGYEVFSANSKEVYFTYIKK